MTSLNLRYALRELTVQLGLWSLLTALVELSTLSRRRETKLIACPAKEVTTAVREDLEI